MNCLFIVLASIAVLQMAVANGSESDSLNKKDNVENYSSLEGHMKPLGSVGPYFKLYEIEGFPSSPREFFNKYVIPSTPVLMKNAAKISPAFTRWTDSYFLNHPGSEQEKVFAEGRKKEIRTEPGSTMTFKRFVEKYNTTDMYMVHGLPKHIQGDVIIPPPLQCEPVLEKMLDVVTWFSSGGTKSVLHNDDVDNINCLYRGNKTLIFINPHDDDKIWSKLIDRPEGGYSSMDVDAVDYTQFPALANVRYARIDMQAGDCLYIPCRWYHQVNSFGSNLAVNLWWGHATTEFLDLTDEICGDFTGRNTIANMTYSGMEGEEDDEEPMPSGQQTDEPTTEEFFERYSLNNKDNNQPIKNTENKTTDDQEKQEPDIEVVDQGISYAEEHDDKHLISENEKETTKDEAENDNEGPYIEQEENSITDKLYRIVLRVKKPVHMSGLKKYIITKFPESRQHWDERCQDLLINYFGMLDQNKDTVITAKDAELYYEADDHTLSQFRDVESFFQEDLQQAIVVSGIKKERELVMKLLDRGELDKEQIATIFGNKLIIPASHGEDELLMPASHGEDELLMPASHGEDELLMPASHGEDELLMPASHGEDELLIPASHGKDELLMPASHGKDEL